MNTKINRIAAAILAGFVAAQSAQAIAQDDPVESSVGMQETAQPVQDGSESGSGNVFVRALSLIKKPFETQSDDQSNDVVRDLPDEEFDSVARQEAIYADSKPMQMAQAAKLPEFNEADLYVTDAERAKAKTEELVVVPDSVKEKTTSALKKQSSAKVAKPVAVVAEPVLASPVSSTEITTAASGSTPSPAAGSDPASKAQVSTGSKSEPAKDAPVQLTKEMFGKGEPASNKDAENIKVKSMTQAQTDALIKQMEQAGFDRNAAIQQQSEVAVSPRGKEMDKNPLVAVRSSVSGPDTSGKKQEPAKTASLDKPVVQDKPVENTKASEGNKSMQFSEGSTRVSVEELKAPDGVKFRDAITVAKKDPTGPTGTKKKAEPKESAEFESLVAAAEKNSSSPYIKVQQGQNEIVQISKLNLNRMVSPFDKFRIETANSNIEVKIQGRSIFVVPTSDDPIGIFVIDSITEKAISLTLLPRDIPAKDIYLDFVAAKDIPATGSSGSRGSFISDPSDSEYILFLKDVMREMAMGDIPKGFAMTAFRGDEYACGMPGAAVQLGQLMSGRDVKIAVLAVKNIRNQIIQIDEQYCYRKGVLAVSAYPKTVLRPGEQTELFVVMNNTIQTVREQSRPSLIK